MMALQQDVEYSLRHTVQIGCVTLGKCSSSSRGLKKATFTAKTFELTTAVAVGATFTLFGFLECP